MSSIFALETSLWEILIRGTVVYLAIASIVRFLPKRQMGNLSPNDVLAFVIIGGLAADAIIGEAKAIPDILLMIVVITFWSYAFNLLEYYFPKLRQVAQDSPTFLIHNGRLLKENLEKEKLTEEELAANLRREGVLDIAEVKQAVLETDGKITVIKNEGNQS